jgi:hypothetical protein
MTGSPQCSQKYAFLTYDNDGLAQGHTLRTIALLYIGGRACNLRTWEAEAGGPQVQDSLDYILRSCLKKGGGEEGIQAHTHSTQKVQN